MLNLTDFQDTLTDAQLRKIERTVFLNNADVPLVVVKQLLVKIRHLQTEKNKVEDPRLDLSKVSVTVSGPKPSNVVKKYSQKFLDGVK